MKKNSPSVLNLRRDIESGKGSQKFLGRLFCSEPKNEARTEKPSRRQEVVLKCSEVEQLQTEDALLCLLIVVF